MNWLRKLFGGKGEGSSGTALKFSGKDRCNRCGKDLRKLSGGVFSGSQFRSMLEASDYPCKSCGTMFCLDCMHEIKHSPCPRCGKSLGW